MLSPFQLLIAFYHLPACVSAQGACESFVQFTESEQAQFVSAAHREAPSALSHRCLSPEATRL